MKCYVQWEGQGEWRGPFEVDDYGVNWVRLAHMDGYLPGVPRAWTLGIDDGWTIREGGECPVDGNEIVWAVLRDGCGPGKPRSADLWFWGHHGQGDDIIAYRAKKPVTLDNAFDEPDDMPPLSVILESWWRDDTNAYRKVEVYDPVAVNNPFYVKLPQGGWVSRDWFRGRRHLTGAELAKEMEG